MPYTEWGFAKKRKGEGENMFYNYFPSFRIFKVKMKCSKYNEIIKNQGYRPLIQAVRRKGLGSAERRDK